MIFRALKILCLFTVIPLLFAFSLSEDVYMNGTVWICHDLGYADLVIRFTESEVRLETVKGDRTEDPAMEKEPPVPARQSFPWTMENDGLYIGLDGPFQADERTILVPAGGVVLRFERHCEPPEIRILYMDLSTEKEILPGETAICPLGGTSEFAAKEISGYEPVGRSVQAVRVDEFGKADRDSVIFNYIPAIPETPVSTPAPTQTMHHTVTPTPTEAPEKSPVVTPAPTAAPEKSPALTTASTTASAAPTRAAPAPTEAPVKSPEATPAPTAAPEKSPALTTASATASAAPTHAAPAPTEAPVKSPEVAPAPTAPPEIPSAAPENTLSGSGLAEAQSTASPVPTIVPVILRCEIRSSGGYGRADAGEEYPIAAEVSFREKYDVYQEKTASDGSTWYLIRVGKTLCYIPSRIAESYDRIENWTSAPVVTIRPDDGTVRTCRIIVDSGRARSDAGTEYEQVAVVYRNERYRILDEKLAWDGKIWYRIIVEGNECYISSGLAELIE